MGYEFDGFIAPLATWRAWRADLPDLGVEPLLFDLGVVRGERIFKPVSVLQRCGARISERGDVAYVAGAEFGDMGGYEVAFYRKGIVDESVDYRGVLRAFGVTAKDGEFEIDLIDLIRGRVTLPPPPPARPVEQLVAIFQHHPDREIRQRAAHDLAAHGARGIKALIALAAKPGDPASPDAMADLQLVVELLRISGRLSERSAHVLIALLEYPPVRADALEILRSFGTHFVSTIPQLAALLGPVEPVASAASAESVEPVEWPGSSILQLTEPVDIPEDIARRARDLSFDLNEYAEEAPVGPDPPAPLAAACGELWSALYGLKDLKPDDHAVVRQVAAQIAEVRQLSRAADRFYDHPRNLLQFARLIFRRKIG